MGAKDELGMMILNHSCANNACRSGLLHHQWWFKLSNMIGKKKKSQKLFKNKQTKNMLPLKGIKTYPSRTDLSDLRPS